MPDRRRRDLIAWVLGGLWVFVAEAAIVIAAILGALAVASVVLLVT